VSDFCPQCDTLRLAQKLRERLQEMTAVSQALSSNLAGDKKMAGYLAVLDKAICVQLRLVRQLELSQRLYNQDEPRVIPALTDLVALGRDVMKKADALTRPLLGIKAEFSSSLTTLPTQADRTALEDMLLFLISNSAHAIGRDGTIRLELERQQNMAVFTVTDTGSGLDPDVLAELFDPLAEPENRARGFSLARRIAELHGGTLMASSTESGGARLAVSISMVDRMGGIVRSPAICVETGGGWDPALVALSDCLPAEAFLPDRGKK